MTVLSVNHRASSWPMFKRMCEWFSEAYLVNVDLFFKSCKMNITLVFTTTFILVSSPKFCRVKVKQIQEECTKNAAESS